MQSMACGIHTHRFFGFCPFMNSDVYIKRNALLRCAEIRFEPAKPTESMMTSSRYPHLAISIREVDQRVYALCPTFGLISEADTPNEAVSTLDDLRERAAVLYRRAGWELPHSLSKEELKTEIERSFRARAFKVLSQIATVLSQIATAVWVTGGMILGLAFALLKPIIAKPLSRAGLDSIVVLADEVRTMPPDRKQKLRQAIAIFAEELGPGVAHN
jgi:hypothetical protein